MYHLTAPFTNEQRKPLTHAERRQLIISIREAGFDPVATFQTERAAKDRIAEIKAKLGITMQFTFEGARK